MVNVPSLDKDHVISAWIVPIENTQRTISVKNFLMIRQKRKRAQTFRNPRPPIQAPPRTPQLTSITEKPMP